MSARELKAYQELYKACVKCLEACKFFVTQYTLHEQKYGQA